jgi:ketosteroid isomerase-like protein
MERIRSSSLIVLFIMFSIVPAVASSAKSRAVKQSAVKEKVILAEQRWLNAYYKLDVPALASLEANGFALVTPSVILTKEQQMETVKKRSEAVHLSDHPHTYTLNNQVVRLFGNVAVISDVCTVAGGGDIPVTTPGTYWQTEVWHHEGGVWKMVHMHISAVAHGM